MLPEPTDFSRLILLRHPELEPSFATIAVGGGEALVGRRGQAQVLRWLEIFENVAVAAVHCSNQPQCVDPARALAAKKQVELCPDPRLADQDMGRWQGRSWDELVQEDGSTVQEFFSNFGESAAPEGESLGVAVERMFDWWKEAAPAALQETLVVVTSGAMISGFATAMLGMRLSRCASLNLPYAGIGVLDCFANGVRLASWNPTALADL